MSRVTASDREAPREGRLVAGSLIANRLADVPFKPPPPCWRKSLFQLSGSATANRMP